MLINGVEIAVGPKAELREADLRGAELYGADLREANLYGADLREADLREANLREANLRGADLREANLRGAELYGANLRGANLRGANLRGANLRGAIVVEDVVVEAVFIAGPLGSRNDTLFLWQTADRKHYVWVGCFRGSGAEFLAAVTATHGNTAVGAQYRAIYEFFCTHFVK